ncbi:RNA 2',3'-cyclic phosphodiesterase [Ferribacterium limneticum]|uniref:RNA 2',3'-cyclic phosphodiesterase n=1 Tax=Ferribacterium limneticum TaxID=76259 RepID=UPI00384EC7F5|nr:RNA 2',3'-cyclic phosphodiesterase [Ferribacterium limneticum]
MAERLGTIADNAALSFGGRATRRDTIHLTLAFLGNVPEARLPELSKAVTSLRAEPFAINVNQLGFWAHNHLLWAGCKAPSAHLDALSSQLRQALARAGFRVGGEGRDFVPHVTLVRRVPEVTEPSESHPLPSIEPFIWCNERFVLVCSTLSALGSSYRIIDEFPLTTGLRA